MKRELFHHIGNITYALIFFGIARFAYNYYIGKIKLSEENEKERRSKIRKYGWFFKGAISVLLLLGVVVSITSFVVIIRLLYG